MRTVILIVTGIFAVFFGASGVFNTYHGLTPVGMYAPGSLWFAARQFATSAVFVWLGWILWRQPRRSAGARTPAAASELANSGGQRSH